EKELLLLPSEFSPEDRIKYDLQDIAEQECSLHQGQANDALTKLCLAIKQSSLSTEFKVKSMRGQKDNTCAQSVLQNLCHKCIMQAHKYRSAQVALISLGMRPEGPTYKPLNNSEFG
ncbi:hypothetical protein K439DRAFT_1346975, partial [Ramaria rubella]